MCNSEYFFFILGSFCWDSFWYLIENRKYRDCQGTPQRNLSSNLRLCLILPAASLRRKFRTVCPRGGCLRGRLRVMNGSIRGIRRPFNITLCVFSSPFILLGNHKPRKLCTPFVSRVTSRISCILELVCRERF